MKLSNAKRVIFAFTLLAACLNCVTPNAYADKPGKSKGGHHPSHKGRGHGNHFGHSRGQTFIDVSRGGVSFGYQNRNFGIQIGPVGGGQFNNHGYGYRPAIVEQIVPVYTQPAIIGQTFVHPNAQPVGPQSIPQWQQPQSVLTAPTADPTRFAAEQQTLVAVHPKAIAFQRDAERAFIESRYEEAAGLVEHALLEDPDNAYLHLFDSQAKFAVGDYPGAMQALEIAAASLSNDQLGEVIALHPRLYPNDHYDRQLKRLSAQVKSSNDSGLRATVLGFHLTNLGNRETASRLFDYALSLDPMSEFATRFANTFAEEIPAPRSR